MGEAPQRASAAALLCLFAAVLFGCAAGSAGRLDMSQEVWRQFRDGQVLPGYRYYTTGLESEPDAILGIREGYSLHTGRWKKRELTGAGLRELVGRMDLAWAPSGGGLVGSRVLDERGEPAGVWYSAVGTTTVAVVGERELRVAPPSQLELDRAGRNRIWGR